MESAIASVFKEQLNRHGYGFQYAVYNKAEQLYTEGKSKWIFQACEVPVKTNSQQMHIDIVLECRSADIFLIGECKRVNPAFSSWCFCRTNRQRNREMPRILVEQVNNDSSYDGKLNTTIISKLIESEYNLGIAVKNKVGKGDSEAPKGIGVDAIENAATQVCCGLNGYVNLINKCRQLLGQNNRARLLPVIFTTAKLYTTEVDISLSELMTGNISGEIPLKHKPWLWFQYAQSDGIIHSLPDGGTLPKDLSGILDSRYIRTIPIVNSEGIESFLSLDWAELLSK